MSIIKSVTSYVRSTTDRLDLAIAVAVGFLMAVLIIHATVMAMVMP